MIIPKTNTVVILGQMKNTPYGGACQYKKDIICQERAGCSGCCIFEPVNCSS